MSGSGPRNASASIEEVLQLIDAQPIPDVDELAHMSMAEIERQLAELGVDTNAQVSELLDRIESPSTTPLDSMSPNDLEQLSLTRVERQLEAEGVDVRVWLSRAETLIRNARGGALIDQAQGISPDRSSGSSRRRLSRGSRAGAQVPASSRLRTRRGRLPQAIAASIVMVAVAGITFSILDQPEFDDGSPIVAMEGPVPAPVVKELLPELPDSRKRESTQLPQTQQTQRPVAPDSPPSARAPLESRVGAGRDVLSTAENATQALVDEGRPVPSMVQPEAPPSPPVSKAALSTEVELRPAIKSPVAARSAAPPAAVRAAKPSPQALETDRLAPSPALVAESDKGRTGAATPRADAASRIGSASTEAQLEARTRVADRAAAPTTMFRAEEPSLKSRENDPPIPAGALVAGVAEAEQVQPSVANRRTGTASRKQMKMARSAASTDKVRHERMAPVSASVADDALATVHEVRAGQTLQTSLSGLSLAKAEQEALARVFSGVDLTRGAILRFSVSGEAVQSATLELPQGHSVSATRDAGGRLVLER